MISKLQTLLSSLIPPGSPRRRRLSLSSPSSAEIDKLEERIVLSATLSNGVLTIHGAVGGNGQALGGDNVSIDVYSADRTKIIVNQGSSKAAPKIFAASDVKQIVFHGTAKEDSFANYTSIPVTAYGYGARDFLEGGAGNDKIYGGDGNDRIVGGLGNDHLYGEVGNDEIHGDLTSRILEGGNDWIWGGAGNDQLFDGGGSDRLIGGTGRDFFSARFAAYNDKQADFISLSDENNLKTEAFWALASSDFRLFGYLWE